jgi:hypothetical protein
MRIYFWSFAKGKTPDWIQAVDPGAQTPEVIAAKRQLLNLWTI